MDLIFGYGAGLLTLINPCVLPILPIVLATALQASRYGPLAMAAGMSLAFVVLGLGVTVLGRSLGITPEAVSDAGAVLMIGFGLVLLVPRFSASFATATAGIGSRADAEMDDIDRNGLTGQFLGGILLGAVWSPCIGPTLGGAISLASQGESILRAGAVMLTFALGVSTVILALGYGARGAIQRRQALMRSIAPRARPILGFILIAVGAGLLLRVHHMVEIWALENLPPWLIDLSVSLSLPENPMNRRTFRATTAAFAATPALAADPYTPGLVKKELAAGKTVFLDFTATWCSTCAAQGRALKALKAENPAYEQAVSFIDVDWDTYKAAEITKSLNIPRRSTLVVLKGDKELGRIVAGTSKAQIKALMDTALGAATSS
ncbi:MAG: cytochrome c biogenesis protein CcdA [Thiohalocapsa sp.]